MSILLEFGAERSYIRHMETTQNKYRFDNAYGKVYEYSSAHGAYVFLGSYLQFGISARNREVTKIRKVEALLERG